MIKKIMSCLERLVRRDDGIAAIEFALIVPMLSLILTGVIDYGMYTNAHMQAQALSRRAAEYVIHGGQEADVQANIIETSTFYTAESANKSPVRWGGDTVCECANGAEAATCTTNCPGDDYLRSYYEVTIAVDYTPLLPYPGIADGVTLVGYTRLQYAR